MSHFACTGSCNAESNNAGVCESEFCSKEGQPLLACDCEDGMHENAGQKSPEEEFEI